MWGWNASTKTRLWSLEAVRNTVSGPGGCNNHCFGWGSRWVSWLCEIWRCFHKSSWAYPMCCISFPDLNGIKVIPGKIRGSCNCVSHAYHEICGSHKTCWASSKFVSLSCPDPSGKRFFVGASWKIQNMPIMGAIQQLSQVDHEKMLIMLLLMGYILQLCIVMQSTHCWVSRDESMHDCCWLSDILVWVNIIYSRSSSSFMSFPHVHGFIMFVVLPGSAGLVNVSVASPPSTAISGYLTHQAERS